MIVHDNTLINTPHARGGAHRTESRASLYTSSRLHLPGLPAGQPGRDAAQGGGRLSGRRRGRLRLGEALRRSGCAATTPRTSAWRRGLSGSTTSSARSAPTTGVARSRRRPSAARSRWRSDGDEIEVWGDGEQTRSYCYIDDCVEGIYRLMRSDHREPINLGTGSYGHRSTSSSTSSRLSPASDSEALRPDQAAGRSRPQQRQHAGSARCSAGNRTRLSRKAWVTRTAGSPARSRTPAPRPRNRWPPQADVRRTLCIQSSSCRSSRSAPACC